ncbi:syntaxin of plants SYP7 [Angomonas deanei]|uniref:t-SNARE coiled-coil homology domain-containing protein n=1 Tax=Angomonas deanei TaxID=59799 RepID=A0A7G2CJJ8_9TRYP|nr:syntaxin of plants SYP7 [Angomonas deanei]CAD2220030.1 hypothetical protein, conserved [Angomonas deanei]|eukprot:EPY26015.1 syntaxin of plants SYP7 [Angomonas deanei]
MKRQLRSLEAIHSATAPECRQKGEQTALEEENARKRQQSKLEQIKKLPPYHQLEYQILLQVAELRKSLRELTEMEKRGKESEDSAVRTTNKVDLFHVENQHIRTVTILKQNCRKYFRTLQSSQREAEVLYHQELRRVSDKEGSEAAVDALKEQFGQLNLHVEKAKEWYKSAFGVSVVSSDANPVSSTFATTSREEAADEERQSLLSNVLDADRDNRPRVPREVISAREDAEFVQFFQSVEVNDHLIDEYVDRIHEGVRRIRDNALFINNELTHQGTLLDSIEVRVEENTLHVESLNRKLVSVLENLDGESLCSYICCFFILVLLLCYLLKLITL